jgi:hypothetical protein
VEVNCGSAILGLNMFSLKDVLIRFPFTSIYDTTPPLIQPQLARYQSIPTLPVQELPGLQALGETLFGANTLFLRAAISMA